MAQRDPDEDSKLLSGPDKHADRLLARSCGPHHLARAHAQIAGELDVSYFDLPKDAPGSEVADITRLVEQEMANLELVDEQGATFQGFTYKPPRALRRKRGGTGGGERRKRKIWGHDF